MAVQLTATAIFVGVFCLLQFGVGIALLRRRGGAGRLLAGLLFFLNGLASIGIAASRLEPAPGWAPLWTSVFDDPTGLLLLLLAWAFWREERPDAAPWAPGFAWGAAAVAAATLLAAGVTLAGRIGNYEQQSRVAYAVVPLYASYGLLMLVLTKRLAESSTPTGARFYALCLIGLGARVIEFNWLYVLRGVGGHWNRLSSGDVAAVADVLARFFLVAATVYALGRLASAARAGPAAVRVRQVLVAFFAAAALSAAVSISDAAAPGTPANAALYLLTLVVVRPLFLGLAYEPAATVRILAGLAAGLVTYSAAKAILALLFSTSLFALSPLDVVAAALAILLGLFVWFWREGRKVPAVQGAPPARAAGWTRKTGAQDASPEPDTGPTKAERLASFLLGSTQATPDGSGVTQKGIEAATGITANNLAGELRRLEALLGPHADDAGVEAPFVHVRVVGVRGRKVYRLTEAGREAAGRLSHAAPAVEKRLESSATL